MEKRKPHYDLALVKRLARDERTRRITRQAYLDMRVLFLIEEDVWSCIASLERRCFQKSMTSYVDHRMWEDLYHPVVKGVSIYLKVQIQHGQVVVVVSFKRK